jgi:hypothetical protein
MFAKGRANPRRFNDADRARAAVRIRELLTEAHRFAGSGFVVAYPTSDLTASNLTTKLRDEGAHGAAGEPPTGLDAPHELRALVPGHLEGSL